MKNFIKNIAVRTMSAVRAMKAKAVAFVRSLEVKALTFHQRAMSGCAGEGYIDTAVKILIAVVLGALLLAGLYALFNDTVMPTVKKRIVDMFNYAGGLH